MRNHPVHTPSQMRQLTLNVGLGFALALLLLLGVIALAVTQMAAVNKQLDRVVSVNNVKTQLATRMRDSLRDRAILMHDIVATADPWERDSLFQEFLETGERYAKDRLQLMSMQDTPAEIRQQEKLDEITSLNSPVMFEVVSAALGENYALALSILKSQAIPNQKRLVQALDEMTSLQRVANEEALKEAYEAYTGTRNFIILLGSVAVALMLFVAVTVSRKVASQARLLDAENLKFQTLFDSNTDAVVILSDQGFVDCNTATLKMFGMTEKELFLRTPITALGAPRQQDGRTARDYALSHITRAYREKHVFMEWIGRRADGSLFQSEIALHAMELSGRPVIQAIMRDISERKQSEEALRIAHEHALQAARAKSEFVANVSHEIRTPIHGIMGMCDLLMREPLTGTQREYASTLRQSALGLLNVINDILDFSKIEAGKLSLEHIPFSVAEVVESVAGLYRPRVLEKSIGLATFVDRKLPVLIMGDPHRLRQILLNLVDNAIKFTQRGEVQIEARMRDTGRLRIEVCDSGSGIPADMQQQLFTAFSQVDASTTRKFGGTGLGLAICRQLTELMQGTIGLISPLADGKPGTLFWLDLPCVAAPPDALAVPVRQTLPEHFSGRVLIAEDNPVNQKVLAYLLAELGLESGLATNGREAVRLVQEQPWDLVLMDWQMPEMDGLEAARAIRQMPGKAGQTPIVALTAQSSEDFREVCLVAGMNDYLAKPFEEAALLSVLARWLPAHAQVLPPPMDVPTLETRHKPEFLRDMMRVFMETTTAALDHLHAALEHRDAQAGKREAHSLRGAAAAMRAELMFQTTSQLENAFQDENWSEAETLFEDLQAEYLRLDHFLRDIGAAPGEPVIDESTQA